jgi:hypothetical protein
MKDGRLVCLGNFPHAVLDFGCDCPEATCPHLTENHIAMADVVNKLILLNEPQAHKRARMQAAHLAKLNGGEVTAQGATPALNIHTGRRSVILKEPRGYRYLLSFAPEMQKLLPLKSEERKDSHE